jgi:hypothetical protein
MKNLLVLWLSLPENAELILIKNLTESNFEKL